MPYLDLSGEDLFYASHDHDHARNLICVHDAGDDHGIWPEGLGNLPGCNTWMLDLPGHGRSGGAPRDSIDGYADVVTDFVDTLELNHVILAGHSMGGAIAQKLALRGPGWLEALILMCTGARLEMEPDVLELIRNDHTAAVERLAALGFGPSAPAYLVEEHKARMLSVDPAVLRNDYEACNGFDVIARLGEITRRTLILSGDIDHITPLKSSQLLEDRMPNARLAVIAPAGHNLPREQPDDMLRIIREFLH